MSSISSILDDTTGGDSYYDPSLDQGGVMLPEGEYYAHVTDVSIKENVVVKSKFLSDIYNLTFTIADKSGENTYNGLSGKAFVGESVKSKGFFRFKKPDVEKHPNLSSNSGSNRGYMELLNGLRLELEKNDSGLFSLPILSNAESEGLPAIVKVVHDKWTNRDGKEMVTPKVISVFEWADGERDLSSLPF
jgi:hypothetical protein